MTAMMQFQSQLEAVERATPRERMGRGKISVNTSALIVFGLFPFGTYRQ